MMWRLLASAFIIAISLAQAFAEDGGPRNPSGVTTFDGRRGPITLQSSDLPAGAAVANLHFTPANLAGDIFTGNTGVTVNYGNLNITTDVFRVVVGGLPLSMEMGANLPSTSALVGSLAIPAGTFSGGPVSWQDAAIVGHMVNYNTTKAGVGAAFYGGVGVNGSNAWGTTTTGVNCELLSPSCTGSTGKDFLYLEAGEADLNVFAKPGNVAPTGDGYGWQIALNATIQNTGQLTGLAFTAVAPIPWKVAIATNNGVAQLFASIAAVNTTGPSNSQAISFYALDSSSDLVGGSMYMDPAGTFQLPGTTHVGGVFSAGALVTTGPDNAALQSAIGATAAFLVESKTTGVDLRAVNSAMSAFAPLTIESTTFTVTGSIAFPNVGTTGTAAGSACFDSAGNLFKKTTTGACL